MPSTSDNRPSFSPARRWVIGANVLASCLALLALMAMINYLANRHFNRFHWMVHQRDQLSPLTLRLLDSLTNEVKIVVFFDPESGLYSSVKGLIEEYRLRCPKLDVEYVDYVRFPHRAVPIKAQYKLTDKDLVIFDSKGRPPRIVYDKELPDYDLSGVFAGGEARRSGFKGERFFTEAILSVTESQPFKAYFLQGHGEHDPTSEDNSTGYQKFSRLLEEKYISVEPLSLLTNDVPADCQLLVIAGPRTRFAPFELEKAQEYLKRGGRAFILLTNPLLSEGKKSGLESVLAEWGVGVGDNLVMDKAGAKSDQSNVLLTGSFGQHPIVNPLGGSRVGLFMPRSVEPRTSSSRTADTAKVAELVYTSSEGRKVTTVREGRGTAETNGVISLAVAVEKGTIQGVSPDRGSTRMVVVGDSIFLGNGMIEVDANHDFASLAINWLLDRQYLLAIGPRPVHEYRIAMTESQMRNARLVLLGGLPGAVLLLGLLVWLRRRH